MCVKKVPRCTMVWRKKAEWWSQMWIHKDVQPQLIFMKTVDDRAGPWERHWADTIINHEIQCTAEQNNTHTNTHTVTPTHTVYKDIEKPGRRVNKSWAKSQSLDSLSHRFIGCNSIKQDCIKSNGCRADDIMFSFADTVLTRCWFKSLVDLVLPQQVLVLYSH